MEGRSPYLRSQRRRTPEEVLSDHLRKFQEGRIDEDVAHNYSEDAVVLSGSGIHRGHTGARRASKVLRKSLPGAHFHFRTRLVEGEYAFLEWTVVADGREVSDGVDTFVIRDGRIVAQTSHYTLPERH